ncbi:hypothetical protein CspeluHIS016_0504340 [Cutaneotrichosporon spelunceum]|uniref:N-acetyl-D-glucosamine kinase n=1 Tax=Cutaneotrichosporon spelunceum TaxID=1672016 RepID=A0AAD3YDX8_9TREE|nr:hypothetical protein CspeluHIS016_0504340 [Cutaneotrichosporon spelunceum]
MTATTAIPTPGSPTAGRPQLILCADGGGSKVQVVIRADDGTEVRAVAGPCNVQSIGHTTAANRILQATYGALAQLGPQYLPPGFVSPLALLVANGTSPDPTASPVANGNGAAANGTHTPATNGTHTPATNGTHAANGSVKLPSLTEPLFQQCWIALAGMTTPADATAFTPFVADVLCTDASRISMTNDVNLLAAPALRLPGIKHIIAAVCGTGTIGRTIRVGDPAGESEGAKTKTKKTLHLADVGVSRGWGYMLCDEGSAFWIGRLAIRELLTQWDREQSCAIYAGGAGPTPPRLPLHTDLLAYFGVDEPTDLIGIVALMTDFVHGLSVGEASSKRNAYLAGAARVVFKWAFPEDSDSEREEGALDSELATRSHERALAIAHEAVKPMVRLMLECLGDRSVVHPDSTAVTLGGGLMNAPGYRALLLDGLADAGVVFRDVLLVEDAAGEGAKALAGVAFGSA